MQTNNETSIDNAVVLSEIISVIPHCIFWKDTNLVFQGCNLQFAQQFGLNDIREIIGKTDDDFPWVKNDLKEKYNLDDLNVIHTGNPLINIEEQQVQTDGSIQTLLVSKVPLKNRLGEIVGVLGVYNNISYLKNIEKSLRSEKEKAEAANRAKTEFLANVSHDVKSPMTGIVMSSDLMMRDPAWLNVETAEQIHGSAEQVL
ncbi:MAG: PAS domain-containing protein, partial [Gammaproteobacteria bacterium]|nr:PAS domain-containing protein [Gammaproteobacteria bacterium]MCD8542947.1 PAS domain-containing protein [Gammaproteobacteria bacterium]